MFLATSHKSSWWEAHCKHRMFLAVVLAAFAALAGGFRC